MTKKLITSLTKAQKNRFPEFIDKWIKIGLSTTPANAKEFEKNIKYCYKLADLKEPNVYWLNNPLDGCKAAMLYSMTLRIFNKDSNFKNTIKNTFKNISDSSVNSAINSVIDSAVNSTVDNTVVSVVNSSIRNVVNNSVNSSIGSSVEVAIHSAVNNAVGSTVGSTVGNAVGRAVDSSIDSTVDSIVNSAVDNAVKNTVYRAVDVAVDNAVYIAVDSAVYNVIDIAVDSVLNSAVDSSIDSAVDSSVNSVVDSAVNSAIHNDVSMAVGNAVGSDVDRTVGSAVNSAVYKAIDIAVDSSIDSTVDSAIHSDVSIAVGSAVNSAVYKAINIAVDSSIDSTVDSAIHSDVSIAVGNAVSNAVGNAVDSAIDSAVVHSDVNNAIGNVVHNAVNISVGRAVNSAVDSSSRNVGRSYFGGTLWSGYRSYMDYFKQVLGLNINQNIIDLHKNVGYYWCLDGVVFATDKPTQINLDSKGRLHSFNKPALLYTDRLDIQGETMTKKYEEIRVEGDPSLNSKGELHSFNRAAFKMTDGFCLYYIHGIDLNGEGPGTETDRSWLVTDPKRLTVKHILTETNIEIRRVMLDLYGIDNFVRESKFETLDIDKDQFGRERKLVRKVMGNREEDIVGIFVKNSSPDGKFTDSKESFKELKDFTDFEQKRIINKYENTEFLIEKEGTWLVKTIHEEGQFIPDLDKSGNVVYKDYFLQVHPELRPLLDIEKREFGEVQKFTCHNAIASTFGLYGDEYCPDVET